jgi:hypothetical protein
MKPSTVFRKAAELVNAGWLQGESAVDKCGDYIKPWEPGAVKFCAGGAVECVIGPTKVIGYGPLYLNSVIEFNDSPSTTKEDVVTLLLFLSEATK